MSRARHIIVAIRVTGDIGVSDESVIESINRLLDMPQWKLEEELGDRTERSELVDKFIDMLPRSGRWSVAPCAPFARCDCCDAPTIRIEQRDMQWCSACAGGPAGGCVYEGNGAWLSSPGCPTNGEEHFTTKIALAIADGRDPLEITVEEAKQIVLDGWRKRGAIR